VCVSGACRCLGPTDYLRAWLDKAEPDASICLTAGTWLLDGGIEIGRGITLKGAGMDRTVLKIKPNYEFGGPVVTGLGDAAMQDLWIHGGDQYNGLYVYGAANRHTLNLQSCRVSHCRDEGTVGSAIHVFGGTLKMTGGEVVDNKAETAAGILITTEGSAELSNCSIRRNEATNSDCGGLLLDDYPVSLTMTDCAVSDNTAFGSGAGMCIWRKATLTRVSLTGNRAQHGYGGALQVGSSETTTLSDCTITGNTASERGGGIYFPSNGGSIVLTGNNVISGNSPENCAGAPIAGCTN
jgi:parallel beta-helix repeat protein